jgi:hypothetical protein
LKELGKSISGGVIKPENIEYLEALNSGRWIDIKT